MMLVCWFEFLKVLAYFPKWSQCWLALYLISLIHEAHMPSLLYCCYVAIIYIWICLCPLRARSMTLTDQLAQYYPYPSCTWMSCLFQNWNKVDCSTHFLIIDHTINIFHWLNSLKNLKMSADAQNIAVTINYQMSGYTSYAQHVMYMIKPQKSAERNVNLRSSPDDLLHVLQLMERRPFKIMKFTLIPLSV